MRYIKLRVEFGFIFVLTAVNVCEFRSLQNVHEVTKGKRKKKRKQLAYIAIDKMQKTGKKARSEYHLSVISRLK